ncbi:hypothetical protein CASFOL_013792 [Castilleja foliolosa]|uniref:KIB1-4 beta-propeller domain-containing protein n=1 Tax=Castilleja foliolosa TaxID=1961234 RepID=A0ABD3DNX7_9LAMI
MPAQWFARSSQIQSIEMAHSFLLRRYSVLSRISGTIANSFARCSRNSGHHRALNSAPSPWLMLPPALNGGGGDMVYRFYNLAENRLESLPKRNNGKYEPELPDDECKFVGSSHGWLALFNPLNNDLFISNPITRRHIKLPSVQTLPCPEVNFRGFVTKVILTCSPDEEDECRALMIFGPEDRLAFCQPGRSTKWTPIGNLYYNSIDCELPWRYKDIVYSSRQKLLFCFTDHRFLECWDLRDPKMIPRICWWGSVPLHISGKAILEDSLIYCSVYGHTSFDIERYVVLAEQFNQVFIVERRVISQMSSDGSYPVPIYFSKYRGWANNKYPYQTYSFTVTKIDWSIEKEGEQEKVKFKFNHKCSLDGAAMFIGMNHSFVITADKVLDLKLNPDCIYFTDAMRKPSPEGSFYGGHDIGMFHYNSRTFEPCFYPWEVDKIRKIEPAPMWFTPHSTQIS